MTLFSHVKNWIINPIFILVVLIVILLIASFAIFFKDNFSKPATTLEKGKYSTIYHFDNAKPDTSKGDVEAKSEIKGQMVEILSQKNLIDTLSSWGTFKQNFDFKKNGKNEKPIKKVIFILTNEKQNGYVFNFGHSSVDGYIKGEELDIKIYEDSDALKNPNDFFTSHALYIPYLWSKEYHKGLSNKEFQSAYIKTIDTITKSQPLFVVYQVGYK